MVLIPYATTYTTTLRGCVPKLVRCEACDSEFVYLLEATAAGEGTSLLFLDNEGARQRSTNHAEAVLQQHLADGCEVVPCPGCGMVQPHMLPLARQRHARWMRTAGSIAVAAAVVLGPLAAVYTLTDAGAGGMTSLTKTAWLVFGLAVIAGTGLLIQRGRLCRRYDPNAAPVEDRKQQGQRLAVGKEEFLKNSRAS